MSSTSLIAHAVVVYLCGVVELVFVLVVSGCSSDCMEASNELIEILINFNSTEVGGRRCYTIDEPQFRVVSCPEWLTTYADELSLYYVDRARINRSLFFLTDSLRNDNSLFYSWR